MPSIRIFVLAILPIWLLACAELDTLQPGAPFYLAHIYRRLEMPEREHAMLMTEWQDGDEPWRRMAGLALLRQLEEVEDWQSVATIAGSGVQDYDDDPDYHYYLLHAYYRLERDVELLAGLRHYTKLVGTEVDMPIWRLRRRLAEAALWEAVVSERSAPIDPARWRNLFLHLFRAFNASEYHTRVYLYLQSKPEVLAAFSDWERRLFEAKFLVASGQYRRASSLFLRLADDMPPSEAIHVYTPRTVRDIGRSFLQSDRAKRGIDLLETIAGIVHSDARAAAFEWLGWLARENAHHRQAAGYFLAARYLSGSDRHLWHSLRSALDEGHAAFLQALRSHYGLMDAPRYYSDLLDRFVSQLIAAEDWELLWEARAVIEDFAAPRDRAHWSVLLAEAQRIGLPSVIANRGGLRQSLEAAVSQQESPYYALLAAVQLGREAPTGIGLSPKTPEPPTLDADCLLLTDGFLNFGLLEQAASQLLSCREGASTDLLVNTALRLSNEGTVIESLRIMETARRRENFIDNASARRLLYPLAWRRQVDQVLRTHRLPRYLFYALLREESYFSPDIVSNAGAVGLSQLMPATASEVAQQLGITDPDLTDPTVNLTIGGSYLSELFDRSGGSAVHALASYNAGINRVRRWHTQHRNDSLLLFVESIPFAETRNYIRKLVVANVRYSELYDGIPATATIKQFFPGLRALR